MVQQRVDTDYEFQKITRERMIWLVKPLFTLGLVVWTLHPGSTAPDVVNDNAQLGFLLGAIFGLFINRDALIYFLVTRRKDTKYRKNRLPDEYYFGKVKQVLQAEGE